MADNFAIGTVTKAVATVLVALYGQSNTMVSEHLLHLQSPQTIVHHL